MKNSHDPSRHLQKSSTTREKGSRGFSDAERVAMKERAKELRESAKKADGESVVLAKIAEMPEPDRSMAQRIHELIKTYAPELSPRTWYGMPAYAKGEKVVCFFQGAQKFNTRYATLGFTDHAHLDSGNLWPVAFALKELTAEVESTIAVLIRKAVEG